MGAQSAAFAAEVHPLLVAGELLDRFGPHVASLETDDVIGTMLVLSYALEHRPDLTVADLVQAMRLMGEVGELDGSLTTMRTTES